MKARKYIAWLSHPGTGQVSVAVGGRVYVEREALAIYNSKRYQDHERGRETTLRITTYDRQLFCKAIKLKSA